MKKRIFALLTGALLLILCAALCASCRESGETTDTTDTTPVETPTEAPTADPATVPETEPETEPATEAPFLEIVSPAEGETVSLLTDEMTKWVTSYKKGRVDKLWDCTEKCEPVGLTLTWACAGDPLYYHVFIADNPELAHAESYLTAQPSLFLDWLFAGTDYWWRVDAALEDPDHPGEPGEIVSTEVKHFATLYAPRTVAVEGVSNIRDIGGKITADGEYRVKQGMIYRGAQLEQITEKGRHDMLVTMGVATEVDVRDAGFKTSSLSDIINFYSFSAPWYSHAMDAEYQAALLGELRVFTDPDNYPVYFHCSLGRDRTGTLAFFLECILGMDMNDVYMDYEVTFFSDYAGYTDATKPSAMVSQQLGGLISLLKSKTGTSDMHEAVMSYLTSIGMTEEELYAIRSIMLEEVKK